MNCEICSCCYCSLFKLCCACIDHPVNLARTLCLTHCVFRLLLLFHLCLAVLEVGVRLTPVESRAHFGVWAIISSPLILGFDLTDELVMQSVWHVVANTEVLAISRTWVSSADYPSGRLVRNSSEYFNATVERGAPGRFGSYEILPVYQVWSKPLSFAGSQGGSEVAVLVVNNSPLPTQVSFTLAELGISGAVAARDVWTHTDNGTITESFSATLAPHDGVFFRLTAMSA